MEDLVEFVLDLVLEGGLEMTKNENIPKVVRYIILGIILLLFIFIIGIIYLTAFLILKQSIIGFAFFFLLATFMIVSMVIKFKKEYIKKINKK